MSGPLRLYNTLTRSKEVFEPIDPENVRLYVCGPTVYDYAHIGNARPVIVFDVLFRLLRHLYGEDHVVYARNITDVDDKINARAVRDYPGLPLNEAIAKVTAATEKQFHDDVAALGCLSPTSEPRATEHIEEMKALIERLVQRGLAYVGEDNILFSPSAMERLANAPRYGSLARRSLDEMLAGARVDVAPYKHDPMDFVLWKPSKPGEPGWPSPAGVTPLGRPGWHIECSAMSMAKLLAPFGGGLSCDDPAKNIFDIHGGGIDLVFPHHENEIAQSCCAFGSPRMANYWMHNGFLQVEGEKMSKSLGNFVTIRELLERFFGGVLRFTMLKTHYREPVDWTQLAVLQSQQEMGQWSELVYENKDIKPSPEIDPVIVECLANDLDTPNAITRLRELYKQANADPHSNLPSFLSAVNFLGLSKLDKPAYFRSSIAYYAPEGQEERADKAYKLAIFARAAAANNLPEAAQLLEKIKELGARIVETDDGDLQLSFGRIFHVVIEEKIRLRDLARAEKDFKKADSIREELDRLGVTLKDSKSGPTTWEPKR
jgi:cysteinyl-tRNA synthetase